MRIHVAAALPKAALAGGIAAAALLVCGSPAQARVTKIIIDRNHGVVPGTASTIPSETITGRAFGELDPADPHNTIITDINHQKDPATFQGSATVPDLCQGGAMEIGDGAAFTAMVGSQ